MAAQEPALLMKHNWKFHCLLGLVFGFLGLFLVYPIVCVLQGSFMVEMEGRNRFTLVFFKLFAESPLMWRCLANSLGLAALTTFACLLVATPLAQIFVHYRFGGKTWWQTLMMSSLILPPFVGAIGMQQVFARFGTLNHWLGLVGPNVSNPHPIDWLGAGGFWGVVIMQTLHLFPILFLYAHASLAGIDPAVREAARSLGASPARVWRTVTLPLLMPGLFAGSALVFVWAFTDLGTPLVFGLNQVVAVQIFDKVNETGFNPFGYTLVIVVLAITVGLFAFSRRLLVRGEFVTEKRSTIQEDCEPLRGLKGALILGGMGLLVLVSLLPHASVVAQSLSDHWFMSALPQKWTTSHYVEIFTLPLTFTALKNSLLFAAASALLDMVLGVLIAFWLVRREFAGKTLLDMLTVLPLALPGLVLAFGYVVGFNVPVKWHGLDLSWLRSVLNPRENPIILLIVSYSIRRLPYLVRAAHAGFQQLHVSLEDASRNLGAGRWTTIRRVVLPLLRGHLVAGGVLTFAFAFLEVSDSLILAMQERYFPVTKAIWSLLGRIEPGAASVACALGVLGMAVLFAAFYTANRILGKKMGNLFG
ncbi:MAG: iron ABC transporter permease [Verrucomicrobiae bacterium]|nr:iron ABC transporter permease [Verrucomicrobiae bacterium]